MGGDVLSGDDLSCRGDALDPSPRITLSKFFREQCPYYMAMGMSYNEYWNDPDVGKAQAYLEAFRVKQKADENRLWRQGLYFYEALCDASPILRTNFSGRKVSPLPYPSEPYPLDDAEVKERKEREAKKKMFAIRERFLADARRLNKEQEDAQNAE